jgi:ABC-type branched-subunit amino acid transport system ATPase component
MPCGHCCTTTPDAVVVQQLAVDGSHGRPAGTLSYADQRRVELARALATEPRLLLLDEPTAGMNRTETDQLGTTLRDLVLPTRAILLIERDLPLIMAICDVVTVLNFGRIIAQGPPGAVAADPAVIEAYLGREDDVAAL